MSSWFCVVSTGAVFIFSSLLAMAGLGAADERGRRMWGTTCAAR
jgi:hypothetical protein